MDNINMNNLNEQEKKVALEILRQYKEQGNSNLFEALKYIDYKEIPVDVETFLKDPNYLGRGLIDGNGKFTVFPYWVKKLKEIFPSPTETAYNTLIVTGSIGTGKSTLAVLCLLYKLYHILCLKDPYLYFGLQPIDTITISMLNITLEAARGVGWSKLQALLQSSPWFMSHGKLTGREELEWQPNGNIKLLYGSSNNKLIGKAILANFTDEVNFSAMTTDIEKIKKKQMKLISQVDARMQSRFMKGTKSPHLQIIVSSKDNEQSFLETYIEEKKRIESKSTLIIDEAQWVVRDDKGTPDDPGSFYVAVGNKFLPSEVFPPNTPEAVLNEYAEKGYKLLKVPPGYYEQFDQNVEIALTDIAGISTTGAYKYISGERLNEVKTDSYKNPFTKDVIYVGTNDSVQYNQYFDMSRIPSAYLSKPLYIHLDLSKSGDKTGIAGTWVIGKRPTAPGQEESKEMFYRVAFSVSVGAPRGFEISFEKTRNFIRWLRGQGFNIKGVSADTFQSAQIQQQLKADGFNVTTLSVDRLEAMPGTKHKICIPYQYFKSVIYEKRIELYKDCKLLTSEIVDLEREPDGHINHPDNGTKGSKDQADAVCGSIYNASLNVQDYSYNYGEDLEVNLNLNLGLADPMNNRNQLTIDFEEELKRLDPLFGYKNKNSEKETSKSIEDDFFII